MLTEALRRALSLTIDGRSALLAGDIDAYFALLEQREPLLDLPDGPIENADGVRGLATQILTLDQECSRLLGDIETGLSAELAEVRRVRQNQRAYASSVNEPSNRGVMLQAAG